MTIAIDLTKLDTLPPLGHGSHPNLGQGACVMEPIERKFVSNLSTPDANGCVLWTGYRQPNGYGWLNAGGVKIAAHRYALARSGVVVPDGADVCHRCDVRACVNDQHLYVGTRAQNMADCTARDRHNKPRGARHWRAKLSDSDVRAIRQARERGDSLASIARRFNINDGTASRITRRVWRSEVV